MQIGRKGYAMWREWDLEDLIEGTVTLIAMSGIGTPVAYRCSAGSGLRRRWLAR